MNSATMVKNFYVSMIRDSRVALLLGPFANHQDALDRVNDARILPREADPFTDFDSFGTVGIENYSKPGTLNKFTNPQINAIPVNLAASLIPENS